MAKGYNLGLKGVVNQEFLTHLDLIDLTAQEGGAWCRDETDEDDENFESDDQLEHMLGKYNIYLCHTSTNMGLLGLHLKCSRLFEFIILIR